MVIAWSPSQQARPKFQGRRVGQDQGPGLRSLRARREAATDRDQRGWLVAEALGEAGKGWDALKFKCLVVSTNLNRLTRFYGERGHVPVASLCNVQNVSM